MGKRKRRKHYCLNCGSQKNLSRHHIFPKRYYHGEGQVVWLCKECHQDYNSFEADAEAKRFAKCGDRKFSRREYDSIFSDWLVKTPWKY